MQDEKVTIQVAAKALSVTPKTIHQWLKTGVLSRSKEGNRTYILMDEVRALRQQRVITSKSKVTTSEGNFEPGNNLGNNIVPVERDHYEGLLTRLGQLEVKQELLLEYKEGLERKDRELAETKADLLTHSQELAAIKSALAVNTEELEKAKLTISRARNELQRLLEIKQDAEAKGKALLDQQAKLEAKERELAEIRAEVERLKIPWWRRLFIKKFDN